MTNEPPKRMMNQPQGEHPVPDCEGFLLLREAYQIRKGEDLLKGSLALKNSLTYNNMF
jgi:hypothetical protein